MTAAQQRHWAAVREAQRANQPPPPRPAAPAKQDCQHRGDVVRLVKCPSCRGEVLIKVFSCVVHGECSLGTDVPGVHRCDGSQPQS